MSGRYLLDTNIIIALSFGVRVEVRSLQIQTEGARIIKPPVGNHRL
ncbi:MAG: hypothetical protein AAFO04_27685 [Cyanobacteria bacterium J06592_8]